MLLTDCYFKLIYYFLLGIGSWSLTIQKNKLIYNCGTYLFKKNNNLDNIHIILSTTIKKYLIFWHKYAPDMHMDEISVWIINSYRKMHVVINYKLYKADPQPLSIHFNCLPLFFSYFLSIFILLSYTYWIKSVCWRYVSFAISIFILF